MKLPRVKVLLHGQQFVVTLDNVQQGAAFDDVKPANKFAKKLAVDNSCDYITGACDEA